MSSFDEENDVIKLKLNTEIYCDGDFWEGRYIDNYDGDIVVEGINSADVPIGRVSATVIRFADIVNDSESLFDVLDSESDELVDLYHTIKKYKILENWEFTGNSIVYLSRIEINKSYRGNGLGKVVTNFLKRLGTYNDLFILKAAPADGKTGKEFEAASKRILNYWKGLNGFERLGRSPYLCSHHN